MTNESELLRLQNMIKGETTDWDNATLLPDEGPTRTYVSVADLRALGALVDEALSRSPLPQQAKEIERLREAGLDTVSTYWVAAFGVPADDDHLPYGALKTLAETLGVKTKAEADAALAALSSKQTETP